MTARLMPWLVRLAGRCADGGERDGGRRIHVVLSEPGLCAPSAGRALCGAEPGRRSAGWVEVDGPEQPTCPRCRRAADRAR